MNRILIGLFAVFCGFFALPAQSGQYDFLKTSPLYYFNGEDWRLITAASAKALDHSKDGVKVFWKNPQTQSAGFVMASNTHHDNSLLCRNLTLTSTANHRNGSATYHVCRYAIGWKIPSDH